MQGHGDSVCNIIDQLLNIELYRRNFQFCQPIFPPDNEEQDLQNEDSQEMMNGHAQFEMHEISIKKGLGKSAKKVLDYDSDSDRSEREGESIIEGNVDADQWQKELDNVYSELVVIEKEIEAKEQMITDGNDFEEAHRRIQTMISLCKGVQDMCHPEI